MRGGLYAKLWALSLPLLAGGCVQATRHSNTLVFGTNTTFGIKVGTGAAQAPSVTVGYDRQEAVIMPLVANTGDNGTFQSPCDFGSVPQPTGDAKYLVHPCSLVAVREAAQDSYSVLASFGAKFDAGSGAAKGGLAQYFATGMAAQLLALSGGASVVATGDAATVAAARKPDATAVQALFGDEAAVQRGFTMSANASSFQQDLIAKILRTDNANLAARIAEFERTTPHEGLANACPERDACARAVAVDDLFRSSYSDNKVSFDQALKAWATP